METKLQLSLSILGRAPAFLFGIAASWLVLNHGERLRASLHQSSWIRGGGADLALLGVLAVLAFILREVTYRGFFSAELTWPFWHLAESALWAMIVLIVLLAPLRSLPLISNRALALLGLLSYSLYLVHEPILQTVLWRLQGHGVPLQSDALLRTAAITGASLLCLALSAATYRFIERPFLVRKERVGDN